jgi:hypothetical protein
MILNILLVFIPVGFALIFVLAAHLDSRPPKRPELSEIEKMQSSRRQYVAIEHAAMDAWEDAFNPPQPRATPLPLDIPLGAMSPNPSQTYDAYFRSQIDQANALYHKGCLGQSPYPPHVPGMMPKDDPCRSRVSLPGEPPHWYA